MNSFSTFCQKRSDAFANEIFNFSQNTTSFGNKKHGTTQISFLWNAASYSNFRCNTRILKQACMLFSVLCLLENDIFHLQVQYLLQYGCHESQTFLMCAMGPYFYANKKSFEYSLNWRNSDGMCMVIHQGYHAGLTTEMLFKRCLSTHLKP